MALPTVVFQVTVSDCFTEMCVWASVSAVGVICFHFSCLCVCCLCVTYFVLAVNAVIRAGYFR